MARRSPRRATTVTAFDDAKACPCGLGQPYGECCGPAHRGHAPATAEGLMRSRFAAFALDDRLRIGGRGRCLDSLHGTLPHRRADADRHSDGDEGDDEARRALPLHGINGGDVTSDGLASASVSSTKVSPLYWFCSSENATSSAVLCST